MGNALEFYDFTTYAYFAVQIGHTFFSNHSPGVGLLLSLATFGAGFALRPLGAILIGRFSDRVGRRPAMLFSFALMGVAIFGLALTPSYRSIGPLAPILVVMWRMCQGFALGGEVGPTTAFLVESAPANRRGLYGAWQGGSQNIAAMAGGLVGVSLTALAGPAALESWGWRAAFLLGALILPFGLLLRRSLPETLSHAEAPPKVGDSLLRHTRVLFLGLGLVASATISTYIFGFMTTYAITTLHMPAGVSLGATVVNGASGLCGGLLGGWLSDRYGRRMLMLAPRVIFLIAIWPAFTLMVRNHDAASLLGCTGFMSFFSALTTASVLVSITESLSGEVRGLGMGAVYATAVAVFGGTTQPIIQLLIQTTHDPLSPAWYMIGATVIGLLASIFVRETAPARILTR
jgi:MFS family permease